MYDDHMVSRNDPCIYFSHDDALVDNLADDVQPVYDTKPVVDDKPAIDDVKVDIDKRSYLPSFAPLQVYLIPVPSIYVFPSMAYMGKDFSELANYSSDVYNHRYVSSTNQVIIKVDPYFNNLISLKDVSYYIGVHRASIT